MQYFVFVLNEWIHEFLIFGEKVTRRVNQIAESPNWPEIAVNEASSPEIRPASSHKTRVSSPRFRAWWRNAEVIPGWTNTGMGRVRLPHIYRFYLSLTALPCRSRRSHTYSRTKRREERKGERERKKE